MIRCSPIAESINSTNRDKLPIFNHSNLIYKFTCRCNSTYIGITCQRPEERVRQHIPRSLLSGQLTSGHCQAIDSAIGEHLLTINNGRTRYEDDCFSVLHRARNKFHLKFLEAIYISMNRPSVQAVKQSHSWYIWVTSGYRGYFIFHPTICPFYLYIIDIYPRFYLNFPVSSTWKVPDENCPSLFYSFT